MKGSEPRIAYGGSFRSHGVRYKGKGGGMDEALQMVFYKSQHGQILGQDDVSLDRIEYTEEVATIYLRGDTLEQKTIKALRLSVKLTIEDMLNYSAQVKEMNMIPNVRGFRFEYADKPWYAIPKSGHFTVTQELIHSEEK